MLTSFDIWYHMMKHDWLLFWYMIWYDEAHWDMLNACMHRCTHTNTDGAPWYKHGGWLGVKHQTIYLLGWRRKRARMSVPEIRILDWFHFGLASSRVKALSSSREHVKQQLTCLLPLIYDIIWYDETWLTYSLMTCTLCHAITTVVDWA